MSSSITLSAGVRANLLSLQDTAKLMETTQNRLATGKKVNSALDNPLNFFTSSALQSRAGDLGSLLDSMSIGIQTIQAANNGLTSITQTVQSMQSTLNQARQDKSFKTVSYDIDSAATGSISFSGGANATGSTALKTTGVGTASTVTAAGAYVAPTAATAGTNSFAYTADATAFGATDTSTFQIAVDGGAATTVTLDQATVQSVGNNDSTIDDINELTSALTAALTTAGVAGVTVSNDGTNVTFTSGSQGASSGVVISSATADADAGGAANTLYGIANGAGTSGAAAVNRVVTIGDGSTTANITLDTTNGATAAAARATIQAAINATALNGTITVGGAGNNIDLTGKADGTNSIVIGGADATSVFGGTATVAAGVVTTASRVKTVDELVSDINTAQAGKVVASNDGGKLRIQNLSTTDLTVTGVNATSGKIDGSAGTSTVAGNDTRRNLINQFNSLRDQLDKLADDSVFNGVNLLRGDNLKITLNESGSSTINIQAKKPDGTTTLVMDSAGLGITSAGNNAFDSDTSISGFMDQMTAALSTLRTQTTSFGSNLSSVQIRQDFTKNMINTLQTGADGLVLADTNEEGANLLALQTRQSLSSTALSMAAQADQNVLRLFG